MVNIFAKCYYGHSILQKESPFYGWGGGKIVKKKKPAASFFLFQLKVNIIILV